MNVMDATTSKTSRSEKIAFTIAVTLGALMAWLMVT